LIYFTTRFLVLSSPDFDGVAMSGVGRKVMWLVVVGFNCGFSEAQLTHIVTIFRSTSMTQTRDLLASSQSLQMIPSCIEGL